MKQVYETLGDKWDLDQPTTKLFEERLRTATSTPLDWVVIDRFERKECDNRHDKAELYPDHALCAHRQWERFRRQSPAQFQHPWIRQIWPARIRAKHNWLWTLLWPSIRESSILRLLHASARCSRKHNAGSRHLAVFPLVLGCVQGKRWVEIHWRDRERVAITPLYAGHFRRRWGKLETRSQSAGITHFPVLLR